jgi:hypothetical protein
MTPNDPRPLSQRVFARRECPTISHRPLLRAFFPLEFAGGSPQSLIGAVSVHSFPTPAHQPTVCRPLILNHRTGVNPPQYSQLQTPPFPIIRSAFQTSPPHHALHHPAPWSRPPPRPARCPLSRPNRPLWARRDPLLLSPLPPVDDPPPSPSIPRPSGRSCASVVVAFPCHGLC